MSGSCTDEDIAVEELLTNLVAVLMLSKHEHTISIESRSIGASLVSERYTSGMTGIRCTAVVVIGTQPCPLDRSDSQWHGEWHS